MSVRAPYCTRHIGTEEVMDRFSRQNRPFSQSPTAIFLVRTLL